MKPQHRYPLIFALAVVALTVDDGPDPATTPAILEELAGCSTMKPEQLVSQRRAKFLAIG